MSFDDLARLWLRTAPRPLLRAVAARDYRVRQPRLDAERGGQGEPMAFWDRIRDLWQRESGTVVHGWIDAVDHPDGDCYLRVSCTTFGLRWDRQRMAGRAPVFVGQVDWPEGDDRIQVTKTLGPSTFTGLHDGDFATMILSSVDITELLPLNQGSVDVKVALISAPQSSLLDRATQFLDDLAQLTQVPQLTTAAPIAKKIASGVDSLLGNEDAEGLIAFMTSVSAGRPRAGSYVLTSLRTADGWALGHLRLVDGHLQLNTSEGWKPMRGADYLVVTFTLVPSQPDRWRSIKAIDEVWQSARERLSSARTADQLQEAGAAALLAAAKAATNKNLTVSDRLRAEEAIAADWRAASERRTSLLALAGTAVDTGVDAADADVPGDDSSPRDRGPARPGLPPDVSDAVETAVDAEELRAMMAVADDVWQRIRRGRREDAAARHAGGRGLVR